MRSPFAPGGPTAYLPLDVTLLWPTLVALAAARGLDVAGIPAPSSDEVGTRLAVPDVAQGTLVPIDPDAVTDIAGEGRSITNAVEVGYRGYWGSRLAVTADVWLSRVSNVLGDPVVVTPVALFDPASWEDYLSECRPADVAHALADSLSRLPVGTVSPQEAAHPTAILLANAHGGAYTVVGFDLWVRAMIADRSRIEGSSSALSADTVPDVDVVGTIHLNVPRRKGSLAVSYRHPGLGWTGTVRGRAVAGFPVVSGVDEGRVDGYVAFDASAGVRLPWRRARVTVQIQNAFDRRHREFVAAPEVRRLALARLQVAF